MFAVRSLGSVEETYHDQSCNVSRQVQMMRMTRDLVVQKNCDRLRREIAERYLFYFFFLVLSLPLDLSRATSED
jgi:hypothetical protein